MQERTTTVWISALIPQLGADTYNGVRLQASLTEEDCYRDLAEWLEIEYENNDATIAALEESDEVSLWSVETQTIYSPALGEVTK